MTQRALLVPLVGAHFRPPAKWVLAHLPAGTALRLEPEPENAYDPKAIRVLCRIEDVPGSERAALDNDLAGTGFDLGEMLAAGEQYVWLGYVADSDGKICRDQGRPGNREVGEVLATVAADCVWATLASGADGKPLVRVEVRAGRGDDQVPMPEFDPRPEAGS